MAAMLFTTQSAWLYVMSCCQNHLEMNYIFKEHSCFWRHHENVREKTFFSPNLELVPSSPAKKICFSCDRCVRSTVHVKNSLLQHRPCYGHSCWYEFRFVLNFLKRQRHLLLLRLIKWKLYDLFGTRLENIYSTLCVMVYSLN